LKKLGVCNKWYPSFSKTFSNSHTPASFSKPAQPAMDFFKNPLDFCVLIPCYNNELGLLRSLRSIRYQEGRYAVVVVDDGSQTPLLQESLQRAAPHITHMHLIRLPQNRGITTALNTGLLWIVENTTAPYIARLDCHDTCDPERFYKQVTFLNAHAQVGLLGSWCFFVEEETGLNYSYTTPVQHASIVKAMHLRNVFIHPAVMFRSALLPQTGLYPYLYPHAEDYALFWTMLQRAEGAVLNEHLTTCAVMRQGLSFTNRRVQLQSRQKIVRAFGSYPFLKVLALFKLYILLIMPKALLLRLKAWLNFRNKR
jgi:glycosyltransferase involved in cell wall biosynthesis